MPVKSSKKILLVDDEKDLLEVYGMRLEINGFNVIYAKDGEDALKKIREVRPDLVLLDLMMPKIDGFEVCQIIKFDDELKNIPVVIISALHQPSERERAIEAGSDAYFIKPIDMNLLIMKVKSLIGEPD